MDNNDLIFYDDALKLCNSDNDVVHIRMTGSK